VGGLVVCFAGIRLPLVFLLTARTEEFHTETTEGRHGAHRLVQWRSRQYDTRPIIANITPVAIITIKVISAVFKFFNSIFVSFFAV
jgi:hypothetical protein